MWYRPEPRQTTVARAATKGELLIADVFADYMGHLLSFASRKVDITIRSGVPVHRPEDPSQELVNSHNLELRTLTPQFYRQLITYPSLSSFLNYTLLDPWEENHTATAAPSAGALINTVAALEKAATESSTVHRQLLLAFISKLLWTACRSLRSTGRLTGAYPDPGLPSARAKASMTGQADSENTYEGEGFFLDEFVQAHYGLHEQVRYVYAVLLLQARTRIMKTVGGE